MAAKGYRTVSITDSAYAALTAFREDLLREGTGSLPTGAAPDKLSSLTASEAIEIAIRAAQRSRRPMKAGRR